MKINNSASTPSEPERISCILRNDGGSAKRCHTYKSDAASPFIGSKMQKPSDNPFRLGSYYAQRAVPPREKNSCKLRCDRGSAKRCHTYTSDAALPFIRSKMQEPSDNIAGSLPLHGAEIAVGSLNKRYKLPDKVKWEVVALVNDLRTSQAEIGRNWLVLGSRRECINLHLLGATTSCPICAPASWWSPTTPVSTIAHLWRSS